MSKIVIILLFLSPSLSFAGIAENISQSEVKTIDYLLKDAESLKYRRLWAAEKARTRALLADSEEEKVKHMESFRKKTMEADHASDLMAGLNNLVQEISDNEALNCGPQLSAYLKAQAMILNLESEGLVADSTSTYFTSLYNFSYVFIKSACEHSQAL